MDYTRNRKCSKKTHFAMANVEQVRVKPDSLTITALTYSGPIRSSYVRAGAGWTPWSSSPSGTLVMVSAELPNGHTEQDFCSHRATASKIQLVFADSPADDYSFETLLITTCLAGMNESEAGHDSWLTIEGMR